MGRKARIVPYKVSAAQSLGADFQTAETVIDQMDEITYLVDTSGVTDNIGFFTLQVRDVLPNTNPSSPTASAWTSLTLSNVPTLNNTDAQFYISATINASESRLIFTSAGTVPNGTCNVWVVGKQVGG